MELELSEIWQEYRLEDVQQGLERFFPSQGISLTDTFGKILQGDVIGAISGLFQGVIEHLAAQTDGMKELLLWFLILGVVSALLTHFIEIFDNHQIADTGFYFVYLLFITGLLRCFMEITTVADETISLISEFIQLFIPTYIIALGISTGTTTATAYYELLLFMVFLLEKFLQNIMLPCISSYVLLATINGIWIEERLSILIETLERLIGFLLKCCIGAITGISIFQSLITPVIDTAKRSVIQKIASSIPGIGNAADGVAEMVVGSAVIIKNSTSVILLVLLLCLVAAPIFKIFVMMCLLRLVTVVNGLISDKRLTNCTKAFGNGSGMLLRAASTAVVLFLISISLAAYSTNRGF